MGFCWATLARTHPCDGVAILAPDRSPLTFGRLATHLHETGALLRRSGIGPADRVVSVLPHGPDAATAALAVSSVAAFAPLDPDMGRSEYTSLFLRLIPKVLLAPAGVPHPAKDAARSLRIPVLEVNRHYEAGVFTLDGRTA